jgi:hypothetical protein
MNATAVAKHYDQLTPEERFRLILAASARGDDEEANRLAKTCGRISMSMQDYAPYAKALMEVSFITYIDLLEHSSRYSDACAFNEEAQEDTDPLNPDQSEHQDAADGQRGGDGKSSRKLSDAWRKKPIWQRSMDLMLAAGYTLGTKAGGWKLFCERSSLPPFLLWEAFPGFDRFQGTLSLTEKCAFAPEGFLRWLNDIRPAAAPELTEVPLTIDSVADAEEQLFCDRVEWYGATWTRGPSGLP